MIVPSKDCHQILTEIHWGHLGVSKMKMLAESYDWWPGLDADIATSVGQCPEYQWVFPNGKPWMNQEIHSLLKPRHAVFKSDDPDPYRKSRYDFHKAVREAKAQYRT
eukprot:g36898.t1